MADEETVYSGLPYWDDRDDPLAWDTLWLGDEMWPGLAEVSDSRSTGGASTTRSKRSSSGPERRP